MGCTAPTVSGSIANELAATRVPNLDLDVYLYHNQGSPTTVPKDLTGSSMDISVDSLAIWGIINANTYALGEALTFNNVDDAKLLTTT